MSNKEEKLKKAFYVVLLLFLLCAAVFFACMYANAAAQLTQLQQAKPSAPQPSAGRPAIAATTPAPLTAKPSLSPTITPTIPPEQARALEIERAKSEAERFDLRLNSYAKLLCSAVHTKKDDVVLIECFVNAGDFTKLIAKHCYEAGAKAVYIYAKDRDITDLNKRYLRGEALENYAFAELGIYYAAGKEEKLKLIQIYSVAPPQEYEMSEAETEAFDTAQYEYSAAHFEEDMNKQTSSPYWTIGVYPTAYWAQKVYPQLAPADALEQLWDQLFKALYIDSDGAVSGFYSFNKELEALQNKLNGMAIKALIYKSSSADLYVKLHEGNSFEGGAVQLEGEDYYFNIPSLELFAMPDKYGVDGTIRATRPFCIDEDQGKTVEGLSLKIADGKIVEYSAEKGEEYFKEYLERDENNYYLGEVALVSADTPIFRSGRHFYTTLLDENAGCHIALGDAYEDFNLREGTLPDENTNESDFHMDFMVGSSDLNVTAVLENGETEPILEKGVWAITAD